MEIMPIGCQGLLGLLLYIFSFTNDSDSPCLHTAVAVSITYLRTCSCGHRYCIKNGLPPLSSNTKERGAYEDKMRVWMESVTLPDKDWAAEVTKCLNNPHPNTAQFFNKTWIHQGAGRCVEHDRVYLKTRLETLLASPRAALIEELHIVAAVPSLLPPQTGGAIVDTCGLGETDVFKINQTHRALKAASGIIMCAPATRGKLKEIFSALSDTDRIGDIYANAVQEQSQDIIFVFNPEHTQPSKRPKAVPRTEPKSVLEGANECEIDEGLKTISNSTCPLLLSLPFVNSEWV